MNKQEIKQGITLEDNCTRVPVMARTQAEIEESIKDDSILACQVEGITCFEEPASR